MRKRKKEGEKCTHSVLTKNKIIQEGEIFMYRQTFTNTQQERENSNAHSLA